MLLLSMFFSIFFFSSRRRHTRCSRDWSSDVCSSDLELTDVNPGVHPKGYASYAQFPKTLGQMFFEVRAEGPPATIVSELRNAVHQTDASLPLIGLKTQAEETSEIGRAHV